MLKNPEILIGSNTSSFTVQYFDPAIAAELSLAEVTVKFYVGRILEKLGVLDRTQAATTALQRGIIHRD